MKSVEAFECQYCKTLYRSLSEMDFCEGACLEVKQEEQVQEDLDAIRAELQNYVRLNAESIEDIEQMCIDISKKLFPESPLKSMELNVRYKDHASNTHSWPLDGVENFRGEKGKPTGYPALTGRISFEYVKEPSGFGSDIFSWGGIIGVNTGSGGSGSRNTYSYDVSLWLDDFPKIKEKVDECLKNNEDFCRFFTQQVKLKADTVDADQFIKELDIDIKALQEQIQELRVKLTNIGKLKQERIEVLTAPLQKEVDKMWKISENNFGIPRPYHITLCKEK